MPTIIPSRYRKHIWSGALQPPGEKVLPVGEMVASIGQPVLWKIEEIQPDFKPPQGDFHCYLVQLAFSLRPPKDTRVRGASLSLRLEKPRGRRPMVLDAFPTEVLEEDKRNLSLTIEPELKFTVFEASLGKAKSQIEFGRVRPVLRTYGLQESEFTWRYEAHPKHPLEGVRRMFAIVALPPSLPQINAVLELKVSLRKGWGAWAVPPDDADGLHFIIGKDKKKATS